MLLWLNVSSQIVFKVAFSSSFWTSRDSDNNLVQYMLSQCTKIEIFISEISPQARLTQHMQMFCGSVAAESFVWIKMTSRDHLVLKSPGYGHWSQTCCKYQDLTA